MTDITITLTDAEYKSLQFVAETPEAWVDNLCKSRVKTAGDDIVQKVVQHCLDNSITIPATRDAIILYGFENNVVETVQKANQWMIDNPPA